ncbi:NUDIX hydrolase [Bosea sp. (in: a-proteobacteria)]|jgi:8-oxo-dGTP pyrophosphatase MutT (NUDIX family)|uniref:NUDIX hydrolase n=1 Tax=Bosea sp. (in: a-proteobacteria) TaxID=1871050 RepID=UPI003F6E9C74
MKKAKPLSGKPRAQIAALPLRRSPSGEPEVLLVTTRTTGRWIVPKGWRIKGKKGHEAAAIEAREEAGVVGKVHRKPVGRYLYWKRMADHFTLCKVTVYLLDVEERLDLWAEHDQRKSHWFSLADAAELVEEPGLKNLLRSLKLS